jgi:hypothetical protein
VVGSDWTRRDDTSFSSETLRVTIQWPVKWPRLENKCTKVGCVFQMENIMESHKLEVSSKETTSWPFVTGRLAR